MGIIGAVTKPIGLAMLIAETNSIVNSKLCSPITSFGNAYPSAVIAAARTTLSVMFFPKFSELQKQRVTGKGRVLDRPHERGLLFRG